MKVSSFQVFDATAVSFPTLSDSFQVEHLYTFSVQLTYTAEAHYSGQVILEASNDGENWTSIHCEDEAGASGSLMLNVDQVGFRFFRINFKVITGTVNTLKAVAYCKGI